MNTEEHKYFTEPAPGFYAEATEEQLNEAKKQAFKMKLEGKNLDCSHFIFYDEPTFMYTYRTCYICDAIVEMI